MRGELLTGGGGQERNRCGRAGGQKLLQQRGNVLGAVTQRRNDEMIAFRR